MIRTSLHLVITKPIVSVGLVVLMIELSVWNAFGAATFYFQVVAYPLIGSLILLETRNSRVSSLVEPVSAVRAWALVGLMTAGMCIAVLLIWLMTRGNGETFRQYWLSKDVEWYATKIAVVSFQQVGLHLFLFPMLLVGVKNSKMTRCLVAAIFGLIHLPSWLLVTITAFAATVWTWLYQRTGRITPLIVSHLIVAILAYAAIPARLNANMGVGTKGVETLKKYEFARSGSSRLIYEQLVDKNYLNRFPSRRDWLRSSIRAIYGIEMTDESLKPWIEYYRGSSPADVATGILTNVELRDLIVQPTDEWVERSLEQMR